MRSKFTPIYTFFAFLSTAFLLIANSGGKSGTFAGAPGDANAPDRMGTCQDCHLATTDRETGNVSLLNLPASIAPGNTYSFTVSLRKPDVLVASGDDIPVGGFQLTATNGVDNTLIGSFNSVAGVTRINDVGRLVQITPQEFDNSVTTWNVEWNSGTEQLPGNITFYVAANAANGDFGRDFGVSGSDYGYNTSQSVATGSALAVNFLNFSAQSTERGVRLRWTVSNERATDYYAVERSIDGKEFTSISTQKATRSTNLYEFVDATPTKSQTYFYRIREVTTDGKMTFSTLQTVIYRAAAELSVYPNPSPEGTAVRLTLPNRFSGQLQLINIQGQVVQTSNLTAATDDFVLSTNNLATGIYQIILRNNRNVYQQRLVIR